MNINHEFDPAHIMKSVNQEQVTVAHDDDATVEEESSTIEEENAVALEPNASLLSASDNSTTDEELAVEHAPNRAQQFTEFTLAESHMPTSPIAAVGDELAVEQAPYFAQQLEALEEERRARQNERAEKEALKKNLREAEEEMNRITQALERERFETERQRRLHENRLQELESRLAADEAAEPENPTSPKATFRIDLYPHQGQFQGKIEHMLTHDKRAFSGLDNTAIGEFIAAHLPPAETKAEEVQKIVALQAHEESALETPMPVVPEPPPAVAIAANPLRLRGMSILFTGTNMYASVLPFGQVFDLALALERPERIEAGSRTCQVAFFAKRLEGGARQSLGEVAHPFEAGQQVRISGVQLPRGTYRLEALVNVTNDAVAQASPYALTVKKFIQIY